MFYIRARPNIDLGKRSLSRNNLLFGLMQRMVLVEKVGSGIVRMKNAMKEYGLDGPHFDINNNWFTIIFDSNKKIIRDYGNQPFCSTKTSE
ncbi:MAG TPA: hypothetical protein EYP22_02220 [Methanosarcinales archaeon]|nr:hypothetical protein [Methanosarcinales archaeon]